MKGNNMPRNRTKQRERQRANRKFKRKEERLDPKNIYGAADPTPYEAVLLILGESEYQVKTGRTEVRMVNNLREKREEGGISQRQLAEKVHYPQSTISELERGVRKPWPKVAKKLSRALKMPVNELFPQDFEQ